MPFTVKAQRLLSCEHACAQTQVSGGVFFHFEAERPPLLLNLGRFGIGSDRVKGALGKIALQKKFIADSILRLAAALGILGVLPPHLGLPSTEEGIGRIEILDLQHLKDVILGALGLVLELVAPPQFDDGSGCVFKIDGT